MKRNELAVLAGVLLTGLVSLHCGSAASEASEDDGASSSAMVTTVSSSYGMTTFGGPGDYQPLACGGNSRTANKWYVASSQRYGCHVHLKLTASNGKCVVVSTEDAGPATSVEQRAGKPILDSSPAVAEYLFNQSGLGWSDVKAHPSTYSVTATKTTLPVGPCSASSSSSSTPAPAPTPAPTTTTGDDDDDDDTTASDSSSDDTSTTGGGQACASDGACNPGNDGSGLICSGGVCVPGCHTDAQCPGSTTCVDGDCQ